MKLIIDIPEEALKEMKTEEFISIESLDTAIECIKNGIPLDDVKVEIFRQSEQNNEKFSHDWNEGFNDGMFHTLTIIRECIKHISGKDKE